MSFGSALLALTTCTSPPHPATPAVHGTCDAVLTSDDDVLRWHVHHDILSVRAPGLASQLKACEPFEVPCNSSVLKSLVTFIYTDGAPLATHRRSDMSTIGSLANIYGIPALEYKIRWLTIPGGMQCVPNGEEHNNDSVADRRVDVLPPTLEQQLLLIHGNPDLATAFIRHPSSGRCWSASAAVLAASSQYFHRLFSGEWAVLRGEDQKWHADVPEDIDADVIDDAMWYAHSNDSSLGWLPGNALERAVALMSASSYFVMPKLFEDAEGYLMRRLQVCNLAQMWAISEQIGSEELRDAVISYCMAHFIEMFADPEVLAGIPRVLLHAVLRDGHLPVSPKWLEQALLRWAEIHLKTQGKDTVANEDRWDYVRDLLPPATLFCLALREAILDNRQP